MNTRLFIARDTEARKLSVKPGEFAGTVCAVQYNDCDNSEKAECGINRLAEGFVFFHSSTEAIG